MMKNYDMVNDSFYDASKLETQDLSVVKKNEYSGKIDTVVY